MVPIYYLNNLPPSHRVHSLRLQYVAPVPVGVAPKVKIFGFSDVAVSDYVFTSIQTQYVLIQLSRSIFKLLQPARPPRKIFAVGFSDKTHMERCTRP